MSRTREAAGGLEAKAEAELSLERNTQWLRESCCPKEVERLAEIRGTGNVLDFAAKVRRIENIEGLEEQTQLALLAEVVEFRHANVQLLEVIAANWIQRQVVLVVGVGGY